MVVKDVLGNELAMFRGMVRGHMSNDWAASLRAARHSALDGIQQLLALIDDVPSPQLRLVMQAACLDVASSVEELSSLTAKQAVIECKPLGSSGEVA